MSRSLKYQDTESISAKWLVIEGGGKEVSKCVGGGDELGGVSGECHVGLRLLDEEEVGDAEFDLCDGMKGREDIECPARAS